MCGDRGAALVRGRGGPPDAGCGLSSNGLTSQVGLLRGPGSYAGSAGPSRGKDWAFGLSLTSGYEAPEGVQIGHLKSLGRAVDAGLGHIQKGKAILS